jgi:hypothetical protein
MIERYGVTEALLIGRSQRSPEICAKLALRGWILKDCLRAGAIVLALGYSAITASPQSFPVCYTLLSRGHGAGQQVMLLCNKGAHNPLTHLAQ